MHNNVGRLARVSRAGRSARRVVDFSCCQSTRWRRPKKPRVMRGQDGHDRRGALNLSRPPMLTADGGVRFAQGSYYRAAQHWRRAAAFIERTSFALLTGRRVQRTIRRIGSGERGTGKTDFLCVYPWRRQFLARSSDSLALNETVTGVPIRRRRAGAKRGSVHLSGSG